MAQWTQADLDRLNRAITGGAVVQSMSFGDQSFTFRSLDEMLKLRAIMSAEVNAANSSSRTRRLAATSKGV